MARSDLQAESAECGLACIAACLNQLGSNVSLSDIRRDYGASLRGATAKDLLNICMSLGLSARVVTCDLEEIDDLKLPSILHWGFDHFVALVQKNRKGQFEIFDPAFGYRWVAQDELDSKFTGVGIELNTTPDFSPIRQRSKLNILSLFKIDADLRGALAKAFVLSILLQLYVLASPYFMQLAIDNAAREFDANLLLILAVGFGFFCVLNSASEALRVVVVQNISAMLSWQMSIGLFRHMVRLPLQWFQSRRLADILTRFDSLDPIKSLIASGAVGAAMDLVLGVGVLIMMFFYSKTLAFIALGLLLLAVAVRLASIPLVLRYSVRALQFSIQEKGVRIDTIRGIQTLKMLGAEARQEANWTTKYLQYVKAQQDSGIASGTARVVQTLIENGGYIFIVYLGVKQVIEQQFSVGMLYAFVSYRAQFSNRVLGVVEQFVSWRMLDMHSNRLADIALTDREPGIDMLPPADVGGTGSVVLDRATFRYSKAEELVLKGVTLRVAPGEFVAIIGKSGSGKSTLLKVLTGLYQPSSGLVEIGGVTAADVGPKGVRSQIGAVLQDDQLMTGTILENVSSFSDHVDLEKIWECLRLVSLEDEVRSFPMKLDTFVGDAGTSLSGGQRQRVLLARALYDNPKILVLDEATSNLDVMTDRIIHQNLLSINITRIIVTHRPETARMAQRVLLLSNGQLIEKSNQNADRKETA